MWHSFPGTPFPCRRGRGVWAAAGNDSVASCRQSSSSTSPRLFGRVNKTIKSALSLKLDPRVWGPCRHSICLIKNAPVRHSAWTWQGALTCVGEIARRAQGHLGYVLRFHRPAHSATWESRRNSSGCKSACKSRVSETSKPRYAKSLWFQPHWASNPVWRLKSRQVGSIPIHSRFNDLRLRSLPYGIEAVFVGFAKSRQTLPFDAKSRHLAARLTTDLQASMPSAAKRVQYSRTHKLPGKPGSVSMRICKPHLDRQRSTGMKAYVIYLANSPLEWQLDRATRHAVSYDCTLF